METDSAPSPGRPQPVSVPREPLVEHRGIAFVPDDERGATPRSLALLWSGGLCNVEYVVYGAAVAVFFHLSLLQALGVIALANASFLLTALASLQGPVAGTSTFAVSRAPFGPNGARAMACVNWATMVAYETEGLYLVVLCVLGVAGVHGLGHHRLLLVGVALGAGAAQGVLPLLGHGAILRVLKVATVPFAILFLVVAAVSLHRVHPQAVHGGWVQLSEAFAFAMSATGLGWTIQASDYSRYLPASTAPRRTVAAVTFGTVVPSVALMALGAAVATAVPAAANNPAELSSALPGWFQSPFLLVVVVQLLAINTLDLYSSGLTLQAVGVPLTRMRAVLVDLVLSTGLTIAALLLSSFYSFLVDLITLLIIWVTPWTAVYLVDWLLRRGRYDPEALVGDEVRSRWVGVPGVRGGTRVVAAVAVICGAGACTLGISTPVFTGPLSRALHGADLSIPLGLVVAGAVYFAGARRLVPAEARRVPVEAGLQLAGAPVR